MRVDLYVLTKVNNKAEILKSILIDRPDRVVDECTGRENGKREYFSIMILVLIQSPNTLTVDNDDVDFFTIRGGSFDGRAPAPKPLGTSVDG